ncbi:MAG: hypothetical protein AAGJ37_01245 [Pseudomonadota bacterium]
MKYSIAIVLLFICSECFCSNAIPQKFVVLDEKGEKLSNIVVEISAVSANNAISSNPKKAQEVAAKPAVMEQAGKQFLPHILLIAKGQEVVFPNTDHVIHHVYSFSPAKKFQLTLKKEVTSDPIKFDDVGIVELGCNVHDWMLGYIYASNADTFGQTALDGELAFDLLPGEYTVSVWHPRLAEQDIEKRFGFTIDATSKIHEITLTHPIYPSLIGYDTVEATDAY